MFQSYFISTTSSAENDVTSTTSPSRSVLDDKLMVQSSDVPSCTDQSSDGSDSFGCFFWFRVRRDSVISKVDDSVISNSGEKSECQRAWQEEIFESNIQASSQ